MEQEVKPGMTLEEIISVVDPLLSINDDNLAHESTRQVKIFTTIQRLYMWNTRELEKRIQEVERVKNFRYRFYAGKLPSDHYKKEPLREAILKSDIDQYLKIDPVLVEAKERCSEQERIVKFIEDAKKMLGDRGYLLRTALDFQRMTLGL